MSGNLERTVVRQHDTTVMVVGPSGRNADRVTAAMEQARVRVVRVGSVPVAGEKLGSTMPQVVVLVAPPSPDMREELGDRASAVGAVVVEVTESVDGDDYEEIVNDIITTAITRKMALDALTPTNVAVGQTSPPHALDDDAVDSGWDE
jgi:hypothetical protein